MHKYILIFILLLSGNSFAEVAQEKLESIFIYKFTSFITWPNPIGDEFKVCVAGDEKLKDQLSVILSGKTIKGGNVIVKSTYADNIDNDCSVLVTGKDSGGIDIERCGKCLHITKREELFTKSMILLKLDNNKVRFDINYKNAVKKNFKIHTKLIRIADHVLE